MAPAADQPEAPACPACGYDLSGARDRTCSECGYALTDEDLRDAERRRVFLEFTSVRAWAVPAVVMAASVLLFYGVPLVPLVCGWAGGLVLSRGLPRLHRRVTWRAWNSSVWWLSLPPLLPAVMFFSWEWLSWNISILNAFSEPAPVSVLVASGAFGLFGIVIWWLVWCRTARIAGVPESRRRGPRLKWAAILTFAPLGLPVAITGVVAGMLSLLDRFFPGWDMPG